MGLWLCEGGGGLGGRVLRFADVISFVCPFGFI